MATVTTEIRKTTVDELRREADALMRAHWRELARDRGRRVLSPAWDRYLRIEQDGGLIALAVWIGDELAGYSVSFVGNHLHYSEVRYAQNDLLFVAEKHRGGSVGGRLIKATEQAAVEHGAQEIIWHAKPGTVLEAGLPRMGYSVMDVMFCKGLS